MANVTREDIDDLTLALTISITKEDYQAKFKKEMEKHRQKSHMKGFRKGKTPMGLIRKMYGGAVLADTVNETLQHELFAYLSDEKLNYLGQPIPADGEMLSDFDPNNLVDYNLKFELGLAPEFDIKGISGADIYKRKMVDIPLESVTEDLEGIRRRLGEQAEVDDVIGDKDLVKIQADELENGAKKENGWATSFQVLFDTQLSPVFSELIKGKKKDDEIQFKVSEVEKDRDEAYVRKYFLNVEDADADTIIGDDFTGKIISVSRIQPAEMNQEFFDKAFGDGKVSNETGAREEIKRQIEDYYKGSSDQMVYRDIQKMMLDNTTIALPEAFLKRWLKMTEEKTDEQLASDFPTFANGLKWTLIRQKLIETHNLEVPEEEILEGFKTRIRSYFGGYGDELVVLNTANRLLQDKKQVDQMYQEMITEKLFKALAEEVTIEDEKLTKEAFEAHVKAIQAEDSPEVSQNDSEEEEIVEEIEE